MPLRSSAKRNLRQLSSLSPPRTMLSLVETTKLSLRHGASHSPGYRQAL